MGGAAATVRCRRWVSRCELGALGDGDDDDDVRRDTRDDRCYTHCRCDGDATGWHSGVTNEDDETFSYSIADDGGCFVIYCCLLAAGLSWGGSMR